MPNKKAPIGSDVGKTAEGYKMNREMETDESETERHSPLFSYRDAFNKLNRKLDTEGYQLVASPNGRFCGFDVFMKSALDIIGLSQPEDFYYFRKIGIGDSIGTTQFLAKVRTIVEDHRSEASKKEAGVWERLALCFDDSMADPKSPLAKLAQSLVADAKPRIATLTGRSGYYKVVPPLAWFPQELQDYNPEDLLTLLPLAERSQLVLILGRLMAGATQTYTAEGLLEHTTRAYGLIVGSTAGMGKSTLLNWLKATLESLGYTTGQLNANLTKFGWGEIATVDLALIDDLTESVQRDLLQNVQVKSIVSNGWLKVEEKGMPAVDVRATSVILGATNLTNYSHYIGMDAGSLSRLNQLDTYTEDELKQAYPGVPDAKIKPYWEAKAREYNCTPSLLAARLLRYCLDRFLAVTGHSFNDRGLLVKDLAQDRLEGTMKGLREQFRIDVSLRHAEELPKAISHLVALTIAEANPRKQQQLLDNLQFIDFSPALLLVLVELFCSASKLPPELAELSLKHLSLDCKHYLKAKMTDLRHLAAIKSVESAFNVIVTELKSNKNYGYPQRSSHYQGEWLAAKRLIPSLVESYKLKLQSLASLDNALMTATSQIETILTQITE